MQAAFAVDGDQLMRPDPYMLPPQSGQAEKTEYDVSTYDPHTAINNSCI